MTQETTIQKFHEMSVEDIAKYLSLPTWLVHALMCNWINVHTQEWSCIATDGYYQWTPIRVALLNAMPLNAFDKPLTLKIYPTNTKKLLEFLSSLNNEYVCYIGHPPTALLINKYLNVKCERKNYVYNGEIMIAFVLRSRTATSGADVSVSEDDLISYVIYPIDNA